MSHELTLPAVGESITEGVLARWLVDDGSFVKEGDPVYELETDKISTEVEADASGTIRIKVAEGDTVEVGGVVATLDTDGEPPAEADEVKSDDRSRSPAEVQAEKAAAGIRGADDDADTHYTPTESKRFEKSATEARSEAPATKRDAPAMSPAVRRLVEEHGLDPAAITASGKGGRLTKQDVLAHLERGSTEDAGDTASGDQAEAKPEPEPEGDGRSAPTERPAPAAPQPKAGPPDTPKRQLAPVDDDGGPRRSRMSTLRKRIAQRLVNAQRTAAILTTFNEIDMSACMAMRGRFKAEFEERHGMRLGFMSFFTRAVTEALRAYPLINAQIDGDDIVEFDGMHVGVAVGTPKGLVVPVLKHAERMSFAEIEGTIRSYAKKAMDGKLGLEDMSGGTFTISNGGTYGSLMSTPIINPPQSGILGMHAIKDRPVAVDGQVVIRPMMYVALSYDHRIVDGAEAVGFLVRIKDLIEAPERLLFDL